MSATKILDMEIKCWTVLIKLFSSWDQKPLIMQGKTPITAMFLYMA